MFRPPHAASLISALTAEGWTLITEQNPYYNEAWLRMERNGLTLLATYDSRSPWAESVQIGDYPDGIGYLALDWKEKDESGEGVGVDELVSFANDPIPSRTGRAESYLTVNARLQTQAEADEAARQESEKDARIVEHCAAQCAAYRGNKLESYLWFSVSAHLRGRVRERRKQIMAERRKAARLSTATV